MPATTKIQGLSGLSRLWWRLNWWLLIVLTLLIVVADAKKIDHERDGKSTLVTNAEWTRTKTKSSECRLGEQRYALNATWNPNLGPPFGVWNCVKCTCTPVQKKRRIVAKVICRNIKQDCPKEPPCKNPVLYPGACCKVCPGEGAPKTPVVDVLQEEEIDSEILSEKDFAVLLNGRAAISPLTTRRLATGRIFLRRGTLHFSFMVDASTPTPATVQFLSEDGDILEELEAQPTPYEVNNGRICGAWTRVPRHYRTVLLKEKMWVALLSDKEEENADPISGKIARYKGVNTEVFSALLSPEFNDGNRTLPSGGMAIISVSAPSDSLHVSLVFNGIFPSNDERNVSIFVELQPSRALEPVRDVVVLEKVFSDVNEAEVRTTLGNTSLRLLTRGKVNMRIWSASAPELALQGAITSRATCNVFHSVITASKNEGNEPPYSAGWGLLFLSNDGDFEYQLRLENLPPKGVSEVILEATTKRRVRPVEDLTTSLTHGWVNGTYGKPTYRDLESLLRGRLRVNVILNEGGSLGGTFEAVSVTEALRSMHPVLLTTPSMWMAATAWVAVDNDCVMHYDIYLAGKDPAGGFDPTWQLQLRENDTTWDPRLDLENVTLEQMVSGREVAAHTTLLTKVSLSRLHHGVSYLDLTVSSSSTSFAPSPALTGHLGPVPVPPPCLLETSLSVDSKQPEAGVQVDAPCKGLICLDEGVKPVVSKKCIDDEKRVYEDGTTWKSPVNNCARCMCTLGTIKCQGEPCPKHACPDAMHLPGQCCPSCPVVSGRESERVCKMDDEFHNIGSFWHPFLAPNGFDLCVTCYCNVTWNNQPVVECSRVACPRLNCFASKASFVDNACCPTCPPTTPLPRVSFASATVRGMVNEGVFKMSDEDRKNEVLADGGCLERKKFLRPNGDVWYPKLSPNGVRRCVSCTCKDGNISCVGMRCERQDCPKGKKCRTKNEKFRKSKIFSKYDKLNRRKKDRRKLNKKSFELL